MKKSILSGILAAVLLVSLTLPAAHAAGTGYRDVPADAWYAQAVLYCRDHGLMGGTGTDTFSPDGVMSRAMLASVIYRLAGSPAGDGQTDFPDVDSGAWYAPAVAWAARTGVMSGYSSGLFGAGDPVTREQLAVILWRYDGSPSSARGADYTDEASIAPYASEAVDWARATGLMSGIDGHHFDPKGAATRAQTATILMSYTRQDYVLIELASLPPDCRPSGLAVMNDGALLVADAYHKVLWRVANGGCTVYAGGGDAADPYGQPAGGYNDDTPANSLFASPWGLAPFLDGWAVSDTGNQVLRLVSSEKVLTINAAPAQEGIPAGDYGVTFTYPTGLAAGEDGCIYVSDTHQGTILRISADGAATVFASGLNDPMGLCWKDGALYVAETGASRILKLSGGETQVLAGSGTEGRMDGAAAQAAFYEPQAVTVSSDGAVYVADTGNSAIRQIKDGVVTTLVVRDPSDLQDMYPITPTGLLAWENTLYVCDSFSCKILALTLK